MPAVSRQGPLVEVTTVGLLVAGPSQPLTVRAPSAAFALAAVEVPGPEAGAVQRVAATQGQVQETFTAVAGTALHALPVRALSSTGEILDLDPVTGASRLIGPTGVEVVSGMSLRVFPRR